MARGQLETVELSQLEEVSGGGDAVDVARNKALKKVAIKVGTKFIPGVGLAAMGYEFATTVGPAYDFMRARGNGKFASVAGAMGLAAMDATGINAVVELAQTTFGSR